MALGATPGLGRVVWGRLRESTVLPEKEPGQDTCPFPPAQLPCAVPDAGAPAGSRVCSCTTCRRN